MSNAQFTRYEKVTNKVHGLSRVMINEGDGHFGVEKHQGDWVNQYRAGDHFTPNGMMKQPRDESGTQGVRDKASLSEAILFQ